MPIIKLTGFSGEVPRTQPRLLPNAGAQEARNTRLTNGGLEPIRRSLVVHTPGNPPPQDDATIYRHNGEWRVWQGLVHAAPGPVAQDRLYYTGNGKPKVEINGTVYDLAVKGPTAKLSGSVSGSGSGTTSTRLYVYTHVTEFGEESAPSPISGEINWKSGQTVTLSGFQLGDASRGIEKQRIYRSQTGPSGTQLYFIAERDSSTSNFTDNIDLFDIGRVLPTSASATPPDDLEGLIPLPGGMMAAFSGKTVYVCEPYQPHDWPEAYTLTVDYPVVALGAFGNSVVVTTEGNPYLVTGTSPTTTQQQKLELNLPCLNPRGMVDMGYAVAYPSHEGLVLVDSSGARIVSENLFSRDDWNEIDPKTIVAGQYDGRYYASYDYLDYAQERQKGTFIIDLSGEQPFLIRTSVVTGCFYYDIPTGGLFYYTGIDIRQWDAPLATVETQTWRSKVFVLPKPTNFGAILIDARSVLSDAEQAAIDALAEEIQARNEVTFNTDLSIGGEFNGINRGINEFALLEDTMESKPEEPRTLTVNVYADDELKASISKINEMSRLPSGFKARKWEIEVSGDMAVEHIALATTASELEGVD